MTERVWDGAALDALNDEVEAHASRGTCRDEETHERFCRDILRQQAEVIRALRAEVWASDEALRLNQEEFGHQITEGNTLLQRAEQAEAENAQLREIDERVVAAWVARIETLKAERDALQAKVDAVRTLAGHLHLSGNPSHWEAADVIEQALATPPEEKP